MVPCSRFTWVTNFSDIFRYGDDGTWHNAVTTQDRWSVPSGWWWYVGGPLWHHSVRSKMTIKSSRSARFFKFVYFTRHSHVTRAESQSNCSISRMCGPPVFHLMFIFPQMEPKTCGPPGFYFLKTGWTTRFFSLSDLLPFMLIFEQTLWHQSCPPPYHHHVFCPLTFLVSEGNKLTQI